MGLLLVGNFSMDFRWAPTKAREALTLTLLQSGSTKVFSLSERSATNTSANLGKSQTCTKLSHAPMAKALGTYV